MKKYLDLLGSFCPIWPGLAPVAVLVYALLVTVAPPSTLIDVIARLLLIVTRTWAAIAVLTSIKLIEPNKSRRPWRFISVSVSLWAVAEVIDAIGWTITGGLLSKPSIVDLLQVSGYLSMVAAITSYPTWPPERFGRIRELLDLFILSLSILVLSWMIFIRPVLEVGLASPIITFWMAVRPVLGFVLFALLFRLSILEISHHETVALRILGLVVLVLGISDLWDGYMLLESSSRSAGLIEAGWMTASVMLMWASHRVREPSIVKQGSIEVSVKRVLHRLEPLLPISFTYAVVGFTTFDWWFSGQVDWLGVGTAAVLALLLVTRQGVIIGQSELHQFIALVDNSADMAFICQANGLIRLANPALRQAIGAMTKDDESLNLVDFMVTDNELDTLMSQALEDNWSGEVWFKHRDGHKFPVSLALRSVSGRKQTQTLIAATAYDLTTVRERETVLRTALDEVAAARGELEALNLELENKVEARTRELEANVVTMGNLLEELKVLDRMKTEFVALVSHELRAPLTNIRSGVELILDGDDELTPLVRESLILVQSETQRLTSFIETILNISTLEAGRFPLEPYPLPIEEIARRVCRRFPETDEAGKLHVNIPSDLPQVLADEQALESVFFHLLDNAHKYSPEGEIWIDAWAESPNVFVAISDAGPGIPLDERERVFDLFHRVDASDKREVYGYGLGLPMVRRLLEAMEGSISAEEGSRGGARLIFWLKHVPSKS
jgi:PAS domain S-box-containing protein